MSTKIYLGFSVDTSSCAELLRRVEVFRPWAQAQAQQKLTTLTAAYLRDNPQKTLVDAWLMWEELRAKTVARGLRLGAVDTGFELVFFPDGERFLGIAYTEHQHWFYAWLRQPGVREYGYWDNTDAPDDMPEDEWARRAQDWDRVLGDKLPSMAGFTIAVTNPQGPMPETLGHGDEQPVAAENSGWESPAPTQPGEYEWRAAPGATLHAFTVETERQGDRVAPLYRCYTLTDFRFIERGEGQWRRKT